MANLAVVGGGIGGCSAAYFASKRLPNVNVTIYDSQERLGGRILTQTVEGATLELGAAFFNGSNRTILNLVQAEGLKFSTMKERADFAVWNGSEIVFRSSKQSAATYLRLLAKYKTSLTRTFLLLKKVKGQVAKLYQQELTDPSDLVSLFRSAGLDYWHKKSLVHVLLEEGVNQDFIDEIAEPITRTIYTQNAGLGGFAGVSALLGVYSGATYSLAEGNRSLPTRLAQVSNAAVNLGQKVDAIEQVSNGSFRVHAGNDPRTFDGVIIAAPLELADIKFNGFSMCRWVPQPYQQVYRWVKRGIFNLAYFGLKNSEKPPSIVLTTREADPVTQFSIQKAPNGESLVTISSPEPINSEVFDGVFKGGEVTILEHCWKAAYPMFKPLPALPPTRLAERLMYVSALEPSVSSMETAALSALNAVQMLAKDWTDTI